MRRLARWGLALAALGAATPAAAGRADVGGYFRVMARPDLQGGNGRLGYWNLYGRLMNEGPYGMLELRYDILEPAPETRSEWASLHVRVEGGSVGNADPGNGSLAQYRVSQVFVKTGNVVLPDVTWQLGTLEYFYGDLGLYDVRPATIFFDTVGISAHHQGERVELLLGAGDSGFKKYGAAYNALPTGGAALRLRVLPGHLEVGAGGEVMHERAVAGNVNAPYHTPRIRYEDWVRGEVAEAWVQQFGEALIDYFPDPVPRTSTAGKAVGYLGFGGAGPLVWNNLFLSWEKLLPEKAYEESVAGDTIRYWVHDFTDERTAFNLGNEMQLRVVPDRLDAAWALWYGDWSDGDNDIVPSDFDRRYASTVLRLQAYATETAHVLVESSVAREVSKNGNRYREHADSIFANTAGRPDTRGLEMGDTDTRNTWQGKGGLVLNPLGRGIYTRPSLRLLYGVQYSNQNNAFGNGFVESLDQYNDFDAVEQHWHHLGSIEAEVWF